MSSYNLSDLNDTNIKLNSVISKDVNQIIEYLKELSLKFDQRFSPNNSDWDNYKYVMSNIIIKDLDRIQDSGIMSKRKMYSISRHFDNLSYDLKWLAEIRYGVSGDIDFMLYVDRIVNIIQIRFRDQRKQIFKKKCLL